MARLSTLVAAVVIGTAAGAVRAVDTVTTDWPSYNRTLASDRYAPLDQINRGNVARLKQLCVFDLDVDVSFQAGPIVIGRTMYVTAEVWSGCTVHHAADNSATVHGPRSPGCSARSSKARRTTPNNARAASPCNATLPR